MKLLIEKTNLNLKFFNLKLLVLHTQKVEKEKFFNLILFFLLRNETVNRGNKFTFEINWPGRFSLYKTNK